MFETKLRALIDFDHKIVIAANHGRLDDPVSFNIDFEPAISRENYSESLPEDLRKIWAAHNAGRAPDAIISSSARETLITIFARRKGNYLISADRDRRDIWAQKARRLRLPQDYLDDALCAIPSHPFWKNYGAGVPVEVSLSAS